MNRIFGGALLIAGTAIGAGMLALPAKTALSSFPRNVLLFVICWLLMLAASFLMLEVSLWFKGETNLVTMSQKTLGNIGKVVTSIIFLSLLYTINVAYIDESSAMLNYSLIHWFGFELSEGSVQILFSLFLGLFIYFGIGAVDIINRIFVVALAIIYFSVIIFSAPHFKIHHLFEGHFIHLSLAFPIVVTSFAYQFIIPTIKTYLNENEKEIKLTILIGSLIPLIIYIIWVGLISGVIPFAGEYGLLSIAESGNPTTALVHSLDSYLKASWLASAIHYFALLALMTSFLGITISLVDFLADGLKINKHKAGPRFGLLVLAIVPSLLFAMGKPQSFLTALGYAGVFIAILVGIIPALMALFGRYYHNFSGSTRTWGGKVTPLIVIVGSLLLIFIHFADQFNWIPQALITPK